MKKIYFFIVFTVLFCATQAQETNDSLIQLSESDTVFADSAEKKHSPKLAAILSAVAPGAGQIYNRKFWKVPIVYVVFGVLGYGINYYSSNYHDFRHLYKMSTEHPDWVVVKDNQKYSNLDLKSQRDFYRKYKDLSILITAAWYFLTIIDANVDGHLYNFDMDDDLTFQISPSYQTETKSTGVSLSFRF
ncbi:MAG: hypothetical protein IPO21_08310 [Bacteroidales bacterium]|nr:hypothetical protein [Bacteroidales bacterium]